MELTGAIRLPRALDGASVRTLERRVAEALSADVNVVTLEGADAATFCSGMDVDAVLDDREAMAVFADLFATLQSSPKPLLAIVDGAAIGGGLGLACACDWVIATSRATFGLPELLWGLAPATIWPIVSTRMATHDAWRWTISAYTRSAAEACASGIVDEVVDPGALVQTANRAVRRLSRLEPHALARMRAWARDCRRHPFADAVSIGAAIIGDLAIRPEVKRRWQIYTAGDAPWSV